MDVCDIVKCLNTFSIDKVKRKRFYEWKRFHWILCSVQRFLQLQLQSFRPYHNTKHQTRQIIIIIACCFWYSWLIWDFHFINIYVCVCVCVCIQLLYMHRDEPIFDVSMMCLMSNDVAFSIVVVIHTSYLRGDLWKVF